MRQSIRVALGLLLLGMILSMLTWGRVEPEVTAAIVGTVADPTGAPIAGAV